MSTGIVSQRAVGSPLQRRIDDLLLQLKGLVHVRALLETRGVSTAELAKHTAAISRVRDELAQLARIQASTTLAAAS
jgi:hypothetical protein